MDKLCSKLVKHMQLMVQVRCTAGQCELGAVE